MSQRSTKAQTKPATGASQRTSSQTSSQQQELLELKKPVPADEFGGWIGTAFLPLALPFAIFYFWSSINYNQGHLLLPVEWNVEGLKALFVQLYEYVSTGAAPTQKAAIIYACWFSLQAFLQHFVPGREVLGAPLPGGMRLKYWLNGWKCFWITLALVPVAWYAGYPLTLLADNYGSLISVVAIWSFIFTFFLMIHAKVKGEEERMSGYLPYDWWMGFARNPRIGTFDLKLFGEARPGLILWVLMNFSMAAKQYELYGRVSISMALVCFFHFWYIADYFYNEENILSTMDIVSEKFGFMLVFGDFCWVPFTYCFQSFYLLKYTPGGQPFEVSKEFAGVIVLLFALGWTLFRRANSQKHEFRRHCEERDYTIWGKKPSYILTKRGTKLLTSGYWGIARHLNYTGDIILGWTWCLPCGFTALAPYFYGAYFTTLDLHRCLRDHHECQKKYGEDWEKYCKKVPYVFIPYVF